MTSVRLVVARTTVGIGASALVWMASVGALPEARGGTQQCNTECQSKMTDCVLACDGIRSCEEACKRQGEACVRTCSSDAAPPPPAQPVFDASLEDAPLDVQSVDSLGDARKRKKR